ncbi:MAG: phosphomannomutase/phosphoglucomutase [Acidimicrobiia bacterium]|nr:phosphomannomutase/phosphoglucomutase [Acidimicrobiia bacterium]MBP8180953.1 phosphomannomutase/phosphoglucomutase [Acidimicrobiia bacterium]
MKPTAPIFKAYDVRGLSPSQIDEPLTRAIGNAFSQFLNGAPIVVGRDMRESSGPLAEAFIEGARDAGSDVIDIGLASTDMLYFASGRLERAGAMFTASHNPAQYNGIKFCQKAAAPIGAETGLNTIRDLVDAGDYRLAETQGAFETQDLLDAFADHVCSFVDVANMRPLKVVADTANGMGGLVVPAVFERLPCELDIIYPELDGTFPNHPADPIQPENLVDLQARVKELGADVGLAFDGDADRVFLVDDNADPVSGSLTTAIVADRLLAGTEGETVVHNLICSKVVPEVIAEHGATAVRTRVGHSFIKQIMAEREALFGGEHSGHYYFRDNFRADSGLIAAVVILGALSDASEPLSVLRRPFERYVASGEINTTVPDPVAVIEAVASQMGSGEWSAAITDSLDGLTVDMGEWWFNLRPSNTEPLLRLNLEASSAEMMVARTQRVQELIAEIAATL